MTSQGYIPSAGIIEILEDFRAQPFLGHEKIILEISGSIYLTSHSLPNRSQTQSTAPRLSAPPLQSPQGLRSLLKKRRKTSLTPHGCIPSTEIIEIFADFRAHARKSSWSKAPREHCPNTPSPDHFRPGDSRLQPSPIPHPGQLFNSLYRSSPQKCKSIHPNTLPARIRLCCFPDVHML